jgi:uncharacterized membrane protein YcaP (DUF421 family)
MEIFNLSAPWWSIVVRTLIIYVAVLIGLRLTGKREMGQMTPFDLVLILLIANAVQNAMVGSDNSVTGGLIAAGVLLVGNYGLAQARDRLPWLRRAVEGTPTLLVNEGKFVQEHLRREGLNEDEVLMAIREHGVADLKDVRMAVLEVDGSISIVPMNSKTTRTRKHVRFVRKGM